MEKRKKLNLVKRKLDFSSPTSEVIVIHDSQETPIVNIASQSQNTDALIEAGLDLTCLDWAKTAREDDMFPGQPAVVETPQAIIKVRFFI